MGQKCFIFLGVGANICLGAKHKINNNSENFRGQYCC